MLRNRFLVLLICLPFLAGAQLVVDTSLSPETLVYQVLTGDGVLPSSVTFNGNPGYQPNMQIGAFSGGLQSIGMESGIILATGGAWVAQGPNHTNTAHVPIPLAQQLNAEPDLAQIIAPAAIRDAAVLEFNFVATGDTLRFRYVFASEEYNDHACSPYNDAFGFFISGPGITGNPNFQNNAKNVALIPGTNVPVAINTVNTGVAGQYGSNAICNAAAPAWQSYSTMFVNNEANPDPNTTQFDGFTVPFLIEVPVVCGETYRIKLAIADAVDDKNDSAVFIEAGSFGSTAPLSATAKVINPREGGLALEGCSSYELRITRPDSTLQETVYLRAHGLVNSGLILAGMPSTLLFPAGQGTLSVNIPTANDHVYSGLREFELRVLKPGACGLDTGVFRVDLSIYDLPPMELNYESQIWLPCHESATLHLFPEGGNPPYEIQWNTPGFVGFTPLLDPESSIYISATISDQCALNELTIGIQIDRESHPPMQVSLPDTVHFDCVNPALVLPEVIGGAGEYSYQWLYQQQPISTHPELNTVIPGAGPLVLEVSDRCAPTIVAQMQAVYIEAPLYMTLGADREGNCATPTEVQPLITGGFEPFTYVWTIDGIAVSISHEYTFTPQATTTVHLWLADACGQLAEGEVTIHADVHPLTLELNPQEVICPGESITLTPIADGGYGAYTWLWHPTGGTARVVTYMPHTDRQYTVTVTDACGHQATSSVFVHITPIEAKFEFDYYTPGRPLVNKSTPDCTYLWSLPGGQISFDFEPMVEFAHGDANLIALHVTTSSGCEAYASQLYNPPVVVFLPTAFTPDGDGLNDVWKASGLFVRDFHLMVFDRWGHMVFETFDIHEGWDGTGADNEYSPGSRLFNWKYIATSYTGAVEERYGTVTLLR